MSDTDTRQIQETCCPVIELRQYAMKPGRRDDLIALFEEHFIEGQEQYGMRIIGHFRNRRNPDRYVWMRGFSDMEARHRALDGFYSGSIWQALRNAANDTLLDSDNVLLLKPASASSGFRLNLADRPALDAKETEGGIFIATVYAFADPVGPTFIDFFETQIAPALSRAGATLEGYLVTEPSKNTFTRLPVREGEHVFVWLASFADIDSYAAYQSALAQDQVWATELAPALQAWQSKPAEVLELTPCRRSLLRHRSTQEK
jgi:hypothetical protein